VNELRPSPNGGTANGGVGEPAHTETGIPEGIPTTAVHRRCRGVRTKKNHQGRRSSAVYIRVAKPGRFFFRDRYRIGLGAAPVKGVRVCARHERYQAVADPLSLPRVPLTKSAQVRCCGNSVCLRIEEVLLQPNLACEREIRLRQRVSHYAEVSLRRSTERSRRSSSPRPG